jgi:DNA-binding MarR family transcriptional regulator
LKPLGVASGHLPVFFALAGGRVATQADLAEAAAIEQPTMAATLKRMERSGLIARTPDPTDRRRSAVRLTEMAETKAAAVLAAVQQVNEAALAPLSGAERERYLDALQKVVMTLSKRLEAKDPLEDDDGIARPPDSP